MSGSGFGRPLSATQRALLTALAAGATLTVPDGGSGLLHQEDGTQQYVAFHTWHSLIRRGSIAWVRPDESAPRRDQVLVGRLTDFGRDEVARQDGAS